MSWTNQSNSRRIPYLRISKQIYTLVLYTHVLRILNEIGWHHSQLKNSNHIVRKIETAKTDCDAPFVLIWKKDIFIELCIDFKKYIFTNLNQRQILKIYRGRLLRSIIREVLSDQFSDKLLHVYAKCVYERISNTY